MLVEFAVDSEAIKPDPTDLPASYGALETLVELWEQYGLLVYGAPRGDGEDFLDQVEALPGGLRQLWERVLLLAHRHKAYDVEWAGPSAVSAATEIDDFCSTVPTLDVMLLDDVRLAELDFGETELFRDSPKGTVEFGRYRFANLSKSFKSVRELHQKQIRRGESTEDVWRSRFEGLARHSDQVVVVDKYAFCQLMKSDESGVERFCRRLAQTAKKNCVLKVYSEFREVDGNNSWAVVEYREKLQELAEAINNGRLASAQFNIVEPDRRLFTLESHDRYIRFDNLVCEIGKGAEVMAGGSVFATSTFSTRLPNEVHKELEYKMGARGNRVGQAEGW